jgi:hypothetical protein
MHARNAANGRLRSGATIKESARIARASIKEYFAELEKFVRECPYGNSGSDGAVIDAISSSTASLIATVNEQLGTTAALAGDASLVRHIQPQISAELSASQETFRSNLRAHWLKSSAQDSRSPTDKVILVAEVACFTLTLVFAILWVREPTGSYEPLTVLFGLGSVASEIARRVVGRRVP